MNLPLDINLQRITLNRKGLIRILLNESWHNKVNLQESNYLSIISFDIHEYYLRHILTNYGINQKTEPFEKHLYCLTGNSQIKWSNFDIINGLPLNYVTIRDNLLVACPTSTSEYTFHVIDLYGKRIYNSLTFPGEYKQVFGCNKYVYIRYSMNDAQYIKIFDASKGFICVKTIHLSTFPKEMNILKIRYSKKSKCLGITYYVPPHEQHFIYWYDFATKRDINTHIIPDKLYYSYFTKHLNLYINNKKYLNPFNKPAISTAIRDELCDTVCN